MDHIKLNQTLRKKSKTDLIRFKKDNEYEDDHFKKLIINNK